ncbi:hypothetical protein AVEN_249081-1 [Araneus ventricosus]|uniref:Uncharacterized protein n=1 Tax=Araneus ventricosus TaxID=182803 RepID=A0A4Y2KYQ8_ARAVE|nr:hypothetical protein AVEN_249081-1 [Araneus ventricosus]
MLPWIKRVNVPQGVLEEVAHSFQVAIMFPFLLSQNIRGACANYDSDYNKGNITYILDGSSVVPVLASGQEAPGSNRFYRRLKECAGQIIRT